MRLLGTHPAVALRDCGHCQRYVYDEQTGQVQTGRTGEPIARPAGTFAPCHYGPDRCPKGSPTAGRELTPQNWRAYRHYLECQATGRFPDDAIVARNAAVIRAAEWGQ